MRTTTVTPTQCSLRDVAKTNTTFLRDAFQLSVGSEALLERLAATWCAGLSRRYADADPTDNFRALSSADWASLAIIERTFAKLSQKHSIHPDEHELGLSMFLEFALTALEETEEEPRLLRVAQLFGDILEGWFRHSLATR